MSDVPERFSALRSFFGALFGYLAGFAAWFDLIKDIFGFVGTAAAAAISVWALVDRIRRSRAKRNSRHPFDA